MTYLKKIVSTKGYVLDTVFFSKQACNAILDFLFFLNMMENISDKIQNCECMNE